MRRFLTLLFLLPLLLVPLASCTDAAAMPPGALRVDVVTHAGAAWVRGTWHLGPADSLGAIDGLRTFLVVAGDTTAHQLAATVTRDSFPITASPGTTVGWRFCVQAVRRSLRSAPSCGDSTYTAEDRPPSSPILDRTWSSALLPELPRDTVRSAPPAITGRVLAVAAGGNLQAALDSARRGDVVELAAGATFTGNFTLSLKAGSAADGWITVRSAGALVRRGQRADSLPAPGMARILTPSSAPALAAGARVSGWWISGLAIGATPANTGLTYALVQLGGVVSDSAQLASHLVLDHVLVWGHDSLETQRCVLFAGAYEAVLDSWLAGCHAKNYDAQAIIAYNGPGPYRIEGNYLEASGENILFGGADPRIAGLIPSDITIRHNWFRKPTWWRDSVPAGETRIFSVKNLLESKNSQRVLVEGNVFDTTWPDGQDAAWVLKSENQSGGCEWCFTGDWTIVRNLVRHVPKLLVLASQQNIHGPATPATRIAIAQNRCDDCGLSDRWTLQLGAALTDVTIARNTMTATRSPLMFSGSQGSTTGLTVVGNAIERGTYGLLGDSRAGLGAWTTYCPGCTWTDNAAVGGTAASWPPSTTLIPSLEAIPPGVGADDSALAAAIAGVVPAPVAAAPALIDGMSPAATAGLLDSAPVNAYLTAIAGQLFCHAEVRDYVTGTILVPVAAERPACDVTVLRLGAAATNTTLAATLGAFNAAQVARGRAQPAAVRTTWAAFWRQQQAPPAGPGRITITDGAPDTLGLPFDWPPVLTRADSLAMRVALWQGH